MSIVNHIASNGEGKSSRASLWIGGDALRPDEISSLLGLEPTKSGVKGEQFGSRSVGVRRSSFWYLKCPLSDRLPLAEHLKWLLDLFEPKLDLINSIAKEWKVMFFCGLSSENGQGGVTFDPSLLRRLANLGILFVLDLHLPESEHEVHEEPPGCLTLDPPIK
jgi:hypothetical protein